MVRYSLVGAATVGFDLARHPHGPLVASVLRTTLASGPDDLTALADLHPGPSGRRDRQATFDRAQLEHEALASVIPDVSRSGASSTSGLLRRLETGMFGDADGLDHLVRRELLDWTWIRSGAVGVQDPVAADAADVLSDAARAAYLSGPAGPTLLPDAVAAVPLVSGWDVSGSAEVTAVLDSVARSDDARRDAWRSVVDANRAHTASWAGAMHRATWAAETAQRLRTAADAQLAAVAALRAGGYTAQDAAYGAWNALAGVLQAALVRDVLPTADLEILLRPWHELSA